MAASASGSDGDACAAKHIIDTKSTTQAQVTESRVGIASSSIVVHTRDTVWAELDAIFRTIGHAPYFEEPVTHTEHALQAGFMALQSLNEYSSINLLRAPSECKSSTPISTSATISSDATRSLWNSDLILTDRGAIILVIASLLHDIGHITAPSDAPHMDSDGGPDVGVIDHEYIGADWLRVRGFAEEVALLVESHVTAKRYLTFKTPEYLKQLASDSTRSLTFQGGPMNASEAKAFETDRVHVDWKIRMRHFDDNAKTPGAIVPPLSYYRTIIMEHLTRTPVSSLQLSSRSNIRTQLMPC